MACAHKQP
ncbi:hypothetical protein D023_0643A, partial [Vibrio parahaemolyticus 3256]